MKAKRSDIKISPHGGAVPILKKIKEFGIPQVIRSVLGVRKKQSRYGYEDVFIAWILTALCGGTRLDHVTKLKKKLNIIPGLKIPSHDTLGRVMKKLSGEVKTTRSISRDLHAKISHTDYDDNLKMNQMLIKATKRIGILKENHSYTLDIDATFLSTKCRGAKRRLDDEGKLTGTKIGFSPMVCLIGDLPVYISLRNGNSSAKFRLCECLDDCLTLLDESKIKIGRLISDAAGYNTKAMAMLDNRGIKFNMRFPYAGSLKQFNKDLKNFKNWRATTIETANFIWQCEVADFSHTMFRHYADKEEAKTYRIVVARIPTASTLKSINKEEYQQKESNNKKLRALAAKKVLKEFNPGYPDTNWKEINGYQYKFYITNDFKRSSEEIILEYNKRGNAERKFSFMKNDFGWKFPPFSNMNENTVFLIAASLANNIFRGIVTLFKKHIPQLRLNSRLPDFKYVFIDVACAYQDRTYIFYNTDIDYQKLGRIP